MLPSSVLAPMRLRQRVGASFYLLKAPIDFTVLTWLEMARDVERLQASDDLAEQGQLLLEIVGRSFYRASPASIGYTEAVEALNALVQGMVDSQAKKDGDAPRKAVEVDYGLLACRLADRFHGTPWEWLNVVPLPVFNDSLEKLGGFDAVDALHGMTVVAVGGGHIKKNQSQQIIRDWRRVARSLDAPVSREPDTFESIIGKLGSIGLKVEVVKA